MFHDRMHAANLLADKLEQYCNSEALVLAVPRGGVPIGYHLANALCLPLDIIPSKRIKDPTNANLTIGSVSLEGIDFLENDRDLPHDYICYQAAMIQSSLRRQYEYYRGNGKLIHVENQTVILVDDKLIYPNQIFACLRSLHKHKPGKIIVAVPIALNSIITKMKSEQAEFIYLENTSQWTGWETHYEYLPNVSDEEVIQLLVQSKLNLNPVYH